MVIEQGQARCIFHLFEQVGLALCIVSVAVCSVTRPTGQNDKGCSDYAQSPKIVMHALVGSSHPRFWRANIALMNV